MTNFYDWNPSLSAPVITILSVSIGFVFYWFLAISPKIKSLFFKKYELEQAWINYVLFQKLVGALFMGFIPGIIIMMHTGIGMSGFGINLNNFSDSIVYTLIIGAIILFLNYFAAKKPYNLAMYPQMKIRVWTKKIIFINSLSWIIYLISYEFMYRGLLLMVCNEAFGFWPAVAINLCFYSATHIAKGWVETVGAFPYGLVLCFITISTGSIFVAVATHLILALSNDYYAIYHHPELEYK